MSKWHETDEISHALQRLITLRLTLKKGGKKYLSQKNQTLRINQLYFIKLSLIIVYHFKLMVRAI